MESVTMEFTFGLVHLIFFVWALINIWGSSAAGLSKLLWSALVLFLPLVGMIIWFFMGPKKG